MPSGTATRASAACTSGPSIDLRVPGAVAAVRRVAEEVADLVAVNHGSLSGEHGDGRLRGELLPRCTRPPPSPPSPAQARPRSRRDPQPRGDRRARPLDEGLRLMESPPRRPRRTALDFAREGGIARAGEACNGNGACRARGATMCPSYQALGDERHSTRGRAVLRGGARGAAAGGSRGRRAARGARALPGLQGLRLGVPGPGGHDAAEDRGARPPPPRPRRPPDRATRRPRARPAGPRVARAGIARLGAALAEGIMGSRPPAPVAGAGARIAPARSADLRAPSLMADTFTRYLDPGVGEAALRVLRRGRRPRGRGNPGCCGRPLLSQGLVGPARRGRAGRSGGWRRTPWPGTRSWCSSPRAGRCSWTTSPACCPAIHGPAGSPTPRWASSGRCSTPARRPERRRR